MPDIPVTQEPVTTQVQETEDVVKRAAQFQAEPKAEETIVEPTFNVTDIDKIEDPQAREQAQRAYKSFQRGFNEKFQQIAELRKELESKGNKPWTQDRIQELLKDQTFVEAAQSVAGMSEQDESMLTESEKKMLNETKQQVQSLSQQNAKLLKEQQDKSLTDHYANYDTSVVDNTIQGLISGKVQATREDIWKVVDYNNAVKRAYQMGLQDKQTQNTEKVTSISAQGINASPSSETIQKNDGESDRAFFIRLATENAQNAGK